MIRIFDDARNSSLETPMGFLRQDTGGSILWGWSGP